MKKKKKVLRKTLTPFWQTTDGKTVRLYHGDVLQVLDRMPARSVHMVVTSPPYWGLRDYGTGLWSGGKSTCDHATKYGGGTREGTSNIQRKRMLSKPDSWNQYKSICGKCGARRVDCQLGSESTPNEYVSRMVEVFKRVRRVLRDDGTVWLNLGDTYNANTGDELKLGNLVGIPWRVALALQADGWVLRQDIIWHKPNPMPESIQNRCTKSHEYIFMLTKSMKYYYDAEAIKTPSKDSSIERIKSKWGWQEYRDYPSGGHNNFSKYIGSEKAIAKTLIGANKRSVWIINTEGYPGAHFATFPTELIDPCILAGTSAAGCCTNCGTSYVRAIDDEMRTIGWEQGCDCWRTDMIPCTVLDPFIGSGTTCCVALKHGRHSVGIDLNDKYLREQAIPRIQAEILDVPAREKLVRVRDTEQQVSRVSGGKKLNLN